MKRHIGLNIVSIICGLFFASGAISHPYNSQLTFREHTTDDGRVIWTNIPKKCFSKGLLTCERLHPMFGRPDIVRKNKTNAQRPKTDSKFIDTTLSVNLSASSSGPEVKLSIQGNKCHRKGTQYYNQTTEALPFPSMQACKDAGGEEPD